MRSQWLLLPLFSALVGSVGADLGRRQDTGGDTTTSAGGSLPSTTEGSGETPPETTTEPPPETTTDSGDDGGDDGSSDVTTTITTTVGGGGGGSTETTRTTVSVTRPTTIVVVETEFETTTVTEQNGDGTATRTVYETTTVVDNERRAIDIAARTIAQAEAIPTDDAPAPTAVNSYVEMMKREPAVPAHLAKRDTITVIRTVSAGGDDAETVTSTFTRTVFDTTTSRSTTTNFITETDEVGATTTETVTSTLTVTSSDVTTGVTEPTETAGDGGNNDGSNDGGGDGGLSTGAKAGIGAGVGVVGLAILVGLGWFCFKKRRSGPKPDHDDMFGSSEVPVGAAAAGGAGAAGAAAAGRRTPPMSHSHSTSTGGGLAPSPAATKPYAAEGYRGTAMGDGRAGYAKPEPYGAAYTRASGISRSPVSGMTGYSRPTDGSNTMTSGGNDALPEHSTPAEMESVSSPQTAELGTGGTAARWENSNAAEIDGQPALNTQSGPVYEMPAQPYR